MSSDNTDPPLYLSGGKFVEGCEDLSNLSASESHGTAHGTGAANSGPQGLNGSFATPALLASTGCNDGKPIENQDPDGSVGDASAASNIATQAGVSRTATVGETPPPNPAPTEAKVTQPAIPEQQAERNNASATPARLALREAKDAANIAEGDLDEETREAVAMIRAQAALKERGVRECAWMQLTQKEMEELVGMDATVESFDIKFLASEARNVWKERELLDNAGVPSRESQQREEERRTTATPVRVSEFADNWQCNGDSRALDSAPGSESGAFARWNHSNSPARAALGSVGCSSRVRLLLRPGSATSAIFARRQPPNETVSGTGGPRVGLPSLAKPLHEETHPLLMRSAASAFGARNAARREAFRHAAVQRHIAVQGGNATQLSAVATSQSLDGADVNVAIDAYTSRASIGVIGGHIIGDIFASVAREDTAKSPLPPLVKKSASSRVQNESCEAAHHPPTEDVPVVVGRPGSALRSSIRPLSGSARPQVPLAGPLSAALRAANGRVVESSSTRDSDMKSLPSLLHEQQLQLRYAQQHYEKVYRPTLEAFEDYQRNAHIRLSELAGV